LPLLQAAIERTTEGEAMKTARQILDSKISHKEFERQIDDLFALMGYDLVYKTWRSLHSPKGFPDRVALRLKDERLIWAELKKEGDKPTPEQWYWLEALKAIGQEAYLWYPHDYERIANILVKRR
jgi:hypothetical protein